MDDFGPSRIKIQASARKDARSIYLYYRRENLRLAQDFDTILDRAILTIEEAPLRWAEAPPGVRRYLLPRFPVTIFYRITAVQVVVLRILHQRRHPDAWRRPP